MELALLHEVEMNKNYCMPYIFSHLSLVALIKHWGAAQQQVDFHLMSKIYKRKESHESLLHSVGRLQEQEDDTAVFDV